MINSCFHTSNFGTDLVLIDVREKIIKRGETMKTTTQKVLTKGIITSLMILTGFISGVQASVKPISCETNFGEKSFTIEGSTVAFHKEQQDGRSISSVLSTKTRKSHTGFRKTVYKNGYKHLINISDKRNFNSENDFLAITSPKGHKMTFPINCSQRE
jgi:hypothetical protein